MKIAIRGHESRGKEVIQILESFGGINRLNHNGHYTNCFYYVAGDNTIAWTCVRSQYRDVFTLEEFEKEFPYKIGETVITTLNHVGTIIGIVNSKYKVLFKEDSALVAPRRLKPYTEMKEERNITLTLDKAKEWYKKGGELREIALQVFTEKELNPLPRSWEEFSYKYKICSTRYAMPSNYVALYQLEQLRDCWRQGWEPDWSDVKQAKCYICYYQGKFKISTLYVTRCFLSFPTYEMAKEFLECFRDLIEKAGDLI